MRNNLKIFFTLSLFLILYWYLFDFLRWNQYDSKSFIGGAKLLFGIDGGYNFQSRLSKPLALVFPGFMELITNINSQYFFLVQNVIFFYLSGFFIYKILEKIYCNFEFAYSGMLIYVTCQPFAVFSLFVLSDVAGWFFCLFIIFLAIKTFNSKQINNKLIVVSGFISACGLLFKESAVTGIIFYIIYILLQHTKFKTKIRYLVYYFISISVPLLISFLIIHNYFNDSIIKRIIESHLSVSKDEFKISELKQIYRIIDVYWVLFFMGILSIVKYFKELNNIIKCTLLSLLISFALMPVWPYIIDRILFMVGPFLTIIALHGVLKLKYYKFLIIFIGAFLNILSAFLIYKYNFNGFLIIFLAFYLILTTTLLILIYKNRFLKTLTELN